MTIGLRKFSFGSHEIILETNKAGLYKLIVYDIVHNITEIQREYFTETSAKKAFNREIKRITGNEKEKF